MTNLSKRWFPVVAFCLLSVAGVQAVTVDNFLARVFTNAQGRLPYRLFVPTNYNAATKYPIVLFLHGSGERGADNRLQLTGQTGELVFASETNQLVHPSFMVAPQCPLNGVWNDLIRRQQLLGLMTALQAQYSLDPDRLYITGLSMGGYGTWDSITAFPNMYAAAVPMSSGGNTALAPLITLMPIWNFHAANDTTVAVSESRNMVWAVRQAGGNVIYTEYASGGHAIWTPAYATPILMDWVYAERRGTFATNPPILTISSPTTDRLLPWTGAQLDLAGTASDGRAMTSVNWTNAQTRQFGTAVGTTNWVITNATFGSTFTNLLLVTGVGTSWYPSLGGRTTFNDVLFLIFPPMISSQPQDLLVNQGDPATFSVSVAPTGSPIGYQWRFNGTNIVGGTNSSLTLDYAQLADAGLYSVQVRNAIWTTVSAGARLTVNRPPVAQCSDAIVAAGPNCIAAASVDHGSFDPDGDPFTLTQFPSGPYRVGTNQVTLTAADNRGGSNSCNALVIVLDQTPPTIVCPADLVVTNAHDAWTSVVTFTPTVSDNCPGVNAAVCSPPSGSAFGLGTHTVACMTQDAAGNSSQCSFTVTVLPGNLPPIPSIQVSPLARFQGWTNLIVIAPDNTNAAVVFDGSKSFDPDDARFDYAWFEGTNLFSTNAVVTNTLAVGTHEIMLLLDDTFPLGTNSASVTVEVISPAQAVAIVMSILEDLNVGNKNRQPLLASLDASAASFERGSFTAGINQLQAFENKVLAQIAPLDEQAAEELLGAAQTIVDALAPRQKYGR
jgi:poly(3-hydroxybutyrate) depolymerase